MEKTKQNTTKEMYYNAKQTQKKLKTGLVAFYDIQPGNRVAYARLYGNNLYLTPHR